jgi:hypothetical protein
MNWDTGLRVLRCGMVSDRRTGWLAVQRMNPKHAFMIPQRGSRLTKRSSTSMPNVNSRRAQPRFAFSPRSRNRRDYPASRSPGCGRVLPAPPQHTLRHKMGSTAICAHVQDYQSRRAANRPAWMIAGVLARVVPLERTRKAGIKGRGASTAGDDLMRILAMEIGR